MEADSEKLRLGGLGCGGDEDERVNRFFALIRSFREVRDRSASEIGEAKSEDDTNGDADRKNNKNKQQRQKKKKKIDAMFQDSPTRTPSFRCEDFAQVAPEYRSASPLPPESAAAPDSAIGNRKRKDKAAEEQQVPEDHLRLIRHGRGLDLNLSLCCSGHDFAEPN